MIHYDTLLQNRYYYKMRQLFFYKIKQKFITKCVRFFVIKCDGFIRKCNSYYKMRRFCYKMGLILQNATEHWLRQISYYSSGKDKNTTIPTILLLLLLLSLP